MNLFDDLELAEIAVPYLRSQLGEAGAAFSDEQLLAQARAGAERAAAYGFETEQQILDFTTAQCLLGENFETAPGNEWAADVLNDEDADDDERAALLSAVASIIVEQRGE